MSIVEIAKKEIGYTEVPSNSNKTKYGKWFGLNGVAWCGIFCSWVYEQAGVKMPRIGFTKPGFAGCQTAVLFFKKKGWITQNPTQGDLVFFDWNGDGRHDHVGLYDTKQSDTTFTTVEGNTSLANNSNGGQVMSRSRSTTNVLFVHIPRPI